MILFQLLLRVRLLLITLYRLNHWPKKHAATNNTQSELKYMINYVLVYFN